MKHLVRTIALAAAVLLVTAGLSSCDDGDNGYWSGPGTGNSYYDSNLNGTWQLIQINEQNVSPSATNYLQFNSTGSGYYYYYSGGLRETQQIRWVCNAGYNRDTLTIRYSDGRQSTMNYYFGAGADYLYLNWTTYTGASMTYCYRYLGNVIPW